MFFFHIMVLILDGNSEYVAYAWKEIEIGEIYAFVTALDLIKSLKTDQIIEIVPDLRT